MIKMSYEDWISLPYTQQFIRRCKEETASTMESLVESNDRDRDIKLKARAAILKQFADIDGLKAFVEIPEVIITILKGPENEEDI